MSKVIKRCISLLVILLIVMMIPAMVTASPGAQGYPTADEILEQINEEYGTNMHVVTAEEMLEKYGIVIQQPPEMTADQLAKLEETARYTAEVLIPQYDAITRSCTGGQ